MEKDRTEGKNESVKNESVKKETRSSGRRRLPLKVKLRLWAIAAAALLIIILIIRLAMYIGSISRTHLDDAGLTHQARYENCMIVHGIDVSEYQQEIKWKKVKSSEADFVFVRAGYRSGESGELNEDASFRKNIKRAKKAGMMVGAYFFSQALNEDEAVEEAEYLLRLVRRYDLDMPLVIDYELLDGGRVQQAVEAGEMPAASMYHDVVNAFCRRVETAGYESAVYANYDMLTNYMDSTLLDDEDVIWAAQYGGACDVEGEYRYWQCAEDASVAGIEGNVDHDIWYIEPGRVYSTTAKGLNDPVSIGDCSIEFEEESCELKNHRAEPELTVEYKDKKLRKGRDYILSFVKNTQEGTGYAIVRGTGGYKDWIAVPFEID